MSLRPSNQGVKTTVTWLVTLGRAGYGVALVAVPGLLIGLTGDRPGRRECAVARVLGVRHLMQAAITVAAERAGLNSPVVLGGGAAVDLLHAASMLALGAVDTGVRRTALTDAAVETGFAAAGGWAAAAALTDDRP
jgi:hypothetical protein